MLQANTIILPVMLAHNITNGVPNAPHPGYMNIMLPVGPDWPMHLYSYVDVYVQKIRQALISINEWDFVVAP